MSAQQTFNEMIDSLTGYEEQAIEQNFGSEILTLLEVSATKAGRALVFTDLTRSGQDAKSAKKRVMDMTIKDINDFFPDDVEEPMPEEPVTEAGKGDSNDA